MAWKELFIKKHHMKKEYFLVLDIGGTQIRSAVINTKGYLLKKIKTFTRSDAGAQSIIKDLFQISEQVLQLSGIHQKLLKGIGISFGGPVDFAKQKILCSQHVLGWNNLYLPRLFEKKYQIPAIIDNDANLAALGEKTFGAGKKVNSLCYITISTGIGGGIIIDGKIWHGAHGLAGEIGHFILDLNGPKCSCGKNGCLEAFSSGTALAKNTQYFLKKHPRQKTVIKTLVSNNLNQINAITIYQAARQKDPFAQAIVNQSIKNLAISLTNLINLFDPEMIIIGGGITNEGEMFFNPLRKYVSELAMFKDLFPLPIIPAKLGDNAGLQGAFSLILQTLLRPIV
ncbi:MAG: Glucokinase [Candidatus Beckwithbacteria bacterium GW2011_GWA2_43_10]|uniref:Glucokinase n=1 Tax=Candidatus Beckwithbacteria bacterium GW2011_GWA2_43_10 TaxID=1618369 RepID=A0A0G1BZZ3_9BACT|nr:MAG: Glucokinase [Candidatus Beckwithbacteria bacterium GW2011_GWA2_43_10]